MTNPADHPTKYVGSTNREPIHGVRIKSLRPIADERGWLMEILRADDSIFEKFGQVYVSVTYPGVVRAWHYHRLQADYMTCIAGMMKLVLFDTREDSPTCGHVNEFFIGTRNPTLVRIPKLVYHGFKCVSLEPALILNAPTEPYKHEDPDEYRLEPHGTLDYDWARRDA